LHLPPAHGNLRAPRRELWRDHAVKTLRLGAIEQRTRPDGNEDMAGSNLSVAIWRGGAEGEYRAYEVPRRDSQTVLDVVTYVQRSLDASLAYRFACRVGMCGSCAMTVNGRPRWTCRTLVAKVEEAGRIEIGPLANLPVIKDLATDMSGFFAKWQRAEARFVPSTTRAAPVAAIKPSSPGRLAIDAAIECINCGVCYAGCDSVRWNAAYLGPAALNRAWTLINDERDAGNASRLRAITAQGGCQSCHSHQSCQQLCPKSLNPTAAIAGIKRRAMQAMIKGEM
jgi:fumarate reductase iron-sulfur subunit